MRRKSEMEMNNGSTAVMSTHRPACIVHTLPDPDQLDVCLHGEIGGFLEVRCETPNNPEFDVLFDGPSPDDGTPDKVFHGSISKPAIIPFAVKKEMGYRYHVQHYKRDGSKGKFCGPIAFNLHGCHGC